MGETVSDAPSGPVPFSGSRPCFFMVSAVFLSRMDIFSFLRFASISEILADLLFPVSFGRFARAAAFVLLMNSYSCTWWKTSVGS